MKDDIKFFGGLAVIVLFCFGVFAIVVNEYTNYQCNNYQQLTGKETKYVQFDICYIKTDAGWQRYDEYKARAIASEGLKK